jgi:hypothetical protein
VSVGGGGWETGGGMDPRFRGGRRRAAKVKPDSAGVAGYLRWVVVILAAVLVGTFAWQGAQKFLHPAVPAGAGEAAPIERPFNAAATETDTLRWQKDFANALDAAVQAGKDSDVTGAEMETDRAAAIVDSARGKKFTATPEFFGTALRELDRVSATHPESDRLRDHVFQAKVSLAEFKSSSAVAESGGAGRVVFSAPRAVSAGAAVTAATIGGAWIDATRMPGTAEVLLPPSTRAREDGVRVSGLTIEGASQTLDGVAWKDVTFVGARLRYEGGAVNLKDVKFVKCRFGFVTDEGGEKLVEAVVRGDGDLVVAGK